jgi:hypothetical protein
MPLGQTNTLLSMNVQLGNVNGQFTVITVLSQLLMPNSLQPISSLTCTSVRTVDATHINTGTLIWTRLHPSPEL